jgi:hypothetical protein
MPSRRPMDEKRRRILVIALIIIILAFWTGFRLYTTGQIEAVWNPSIPPSDSVQAPVPAKCVPEYAELRILGGRMTPISQQSPQFRDETCLVGCWQEYDVKSYRITLDEDRQAQCSCDIKDCSPKELPDWYLEQ